MFMWTTPLKWRQDCYICTEPAWINSPHFTLNLDLRVLNEAWTRDIDVPLQTLAECDRDEFVQTTPFWGATRSCLTSVTTYTSLCNNKVWGIFFLLRLRREWWKSEANLFLDNQGTWAAFKLYISINVYGVSLQCTDIRATSSPDSATLCNEIPRERTWTVLWLLLVTAWFYSLCAIGRVLKV